MAEITLKELLNTASFETRLAEATACVKAQPDNSAARELLFKFYCIEGDWNKALAQLETLKQLDPEYTKRVELYKSLVMSEILRARVLAGDIAPAGLEAQMPEWVALLHEANQRYAAGDDVASFSWIADSDERLGPVCELICAGGYRWVPFAALRELSVRRPVDLLDLLWLPASVTLESGQFQGYIPARYPLTPDATQETKLGSLTDWQHVSDSLWLGRGRKMLITDNAEYALPALQTLRFR
ncbi:type VI secretion system accessory protein TagJ [Cronobacter dublinensis]|uniref:type VI secretion system accessory protein TagJ n=1 Tax=Cronobacter dublinensis TaxID=413497 RepID=UPI000CFE1A27|nr:type VI secretion system accessory protein TagJ [Cronobacter dublinensis]